MQLELLKRMCSDFHDSLASKMLYYSLVRYHIDCVILTWHPDGINQNQSVFSVQNSFLIY